MRARGTRGRLAMSSGLAAMAVGALAIQVFAADITVNRTGNAGDPTPADGICDVDLGASGRQCTLRAAITTANAATGLDKIKFAFGGSGAKVINVPAGLPAIEDALVIDGYTAANTKPNSRTTGSNAKLRIVLRGPSSGPVDGLHVLAPSTIRGLVIQRFRDGIYIGPGGEGSVVIGNVIGANPSGTGLVGIRHFGIHVDCDSAVAIGGNTLASRNLIAGSRSAGILLCETVDGTTVRGNLLGVGSNGSRDLGNVGPGILGYGSRDVTIGGESKASQNVIAYNSEGVVLEDNGSHEASGVRILGNSFFHNSRLAIDLDGDGVTPNDGAGDPDDGSNHRQNFPILTVAKNQNGKTRVEGNVRGEASSTYHIRFFLDRYNEREGTKYLKRLTVTTDASGRASFKTTVPKQAAGRRITATATNLSRSPAETSEFAASRRIR